MSCRLSVGWQYKCNVNDPDDWDVIPLDMPITCSPAATESSLHQADVQKEKTRNSGYSRETAAGPSKMF